jgi:hypothetical protein
MSQCFKFVAEILRVYNGKNPITNESFPMVEYMLVHFEPQVALTVPKEQAPNIIGLNKNNVFPAPAQVPFDFFEAHALNAVCEIFNNEEDIESYRIIKEQISDHPVTGNKVLDIVIQIEPQNRSIKILKIGEMLNAQNTRRRR